MKRPTRIAISVVIVYCIYTMLDVSITAYFGVNI
jgi:hypothetical protein